MAGKQTVVDPARVLILTRLLKAPRRLVYEAWTNPRYLEHWWGPTGFTTTTSAFDLAPGGAWHFVMHGPDGTDYQNRIVFEDIEPAKRLAYHHDDGGGGDKFQTIITFEDVDGKTRVTMHAEFPSAEELERHIRDHGAAEGGRQHLDRLVVFVAGLCAGRA